MNDTICKAFIATCLFSILTFSGECAAGSADEKTIQQTDRNVILFYISKTWKTLSRSMTDCNSLSDPKTHIKSTLYLPADLPMPKSVANLKKRCAIDVKRLPAKINHLGQVNGDKIQPAGLLYLPYAYIVPGGRFNEMYGWDSYFIIRGLIESNKNALAHGMVENFFFEIEHYGGTLNGNRTYYLSRTQLPFLAPIIRAVYEADQMHGQASLKWLQKAYTYAVKDYSLWTHDPHLAGNTQLSRYYDFGDGPVPEMDDPSARSYYVDVLKYFVQHPKEAQPYLLHFPDEVAKSLPAGSYFNISICDKTLDASKKDFNVCKEVKNLGLTENFYKGDRAMRESGFDTSFRFGPFSADTMNYAPVDLNSLLYKAETDLAWMSKQLGNKAEAAKWEAIAEKRKERFNHYLWNEKRGLYFDYDFVTHQQSRFAYATTYYPLWAGLASREQAKKVIANLKYFEKPGGIVTSLRRTGVQWDYPYGWAPIQLIAIEGMDQYGYYTDAERISNKFLMMVLKNFMHDRTIHEKYDVVNGSSQTDIQVGYKSNVTGFGWTNGVFLVLMHKMFNQPTKSNVVDPYNVPQVSANQLPAK